MLAYFTDALATPYPARDTMALTVFKAKSFVNSAFFALSDWPDHNVAGDVNVIENCIVPSLFGTIDALPAHAKPFTRNRFQSVVSPY